MKKSWQKWKQFSKKVIGIEATIIFSIIFIILITPIAFVLRSVNPSILLGSAASTRKNSYWNKIPQKKYDISFARKQ